VRVVSDCAAVTELLPLSPDELLTTTRAVRKRLDLTRPVPRDVIEECIEIGVQAPSGSNRQAWQWVPVDDADTKLHLAELYREVFDDYQPRSAGYTDGDTRAERRSAVTASAVHLRDHLHEVPVLLVVYQEGRIEELPLGSHPGFWGSVVPAIWSFMLALRARGLGSAWTTMTCRREPQVAEVLGVPHDKYTQVGLFPVAYTIGTEFKPAARLDPASVIHWNRW
jgi:nitroreductase